MANVTVLTVGGQNYEIKDNQAVIDSNIANASTSANIFTIDAWENGAIVEATGANTNSTERIRTKDFIPATVGKVYTSNADGSFGLYAWNASGTYIGMLYDGAFVTDGSGTFYHIIDMQELYLNPAYYGYKYKLSYRIAGGSVQIDTVSGVVMETLLYQVPKNAKAVSDIEKSIGLNLFDVSFFENGSIRYADGTGVSSTARIRTKDYIPDTMNLFYSTNSSIQFLLYAWDESDTYVGAWYNETFGETDVAYLERLDMTEFRTNSNYRGYKYKVCIRSSTGDVQISNVSGVYIDGALQTLQNVSIKEKTLNLSTNYNINNALLWENGGIRLSDGINVASASRARTRTVLPTNAGVIRFNSHTQYRGIFIAAYDLNGVYQGAYKSDGTFVKDGTETGYTTFDIQDLYRRFPGYRFRLAVYVRNSGPAVTPDEYEEWTITNGIYSKPSVLKVIQYNVGKFNRGFAHTTVKITDPQTKLLNYKEFFANENPDFLCMQECTQYFNTDDTMNTDSVLFNPFFFNKSWYEKETAIKSQFPLYKSSFSYLQTTGDNASWCVYGETYVDGKKIAIASGVLNVEAPSGIDHSEQQIRALTKLVEGDLQGGLGFNFSNYDYAIICMDTNCLNQTEADTVKTFMAGKGYKTGNWDYLGYKDTYNPSSSDYKAIDNVFVKGNAHITNFAVPSVYDELSSDHFPVIAEIRLM